MGKHTIILISLIFLGCVCLALAFLLTFQSTTNQKNKATVVPSVQTESRPAVMTIVPATATTAQVILTAYETLPTLIQLEIGYDLSTVSDVSITPGAFFPSPSIPLDSTNPNIGRISYALTGTPGQQVNGRATVVATITFIPQSYTEQATKFELLPKTMIRGATGSVLPLTLQN